MVALQVAGLVLGIVSALLLVPTVVLCVQAVLARREAVLPAPTATGARPRIAVLMPAHNESAGVAVAIAAIRAQLGGSDRLIVVADNCTDDTASVAAAAGSTVVERHDPTRRGKGHALDFGVRALETDPPEVVIVVDADCIAAPGSLDRLGRECVARARPVQALYLMHAPAGASRRARLAEFAWLVRNQVRPLGAMRMAWPCQLMGTGMAFPWTLLRNAALASGHLVEDLELGLSLASAGSPPLFCPSALVTSVFPTQAGAMTAQRTRWEHGHFALIAGAAPRLVWRGLTTARPALVAMALDLGVPPLAFLVLMLSGCLVAATGIAALGGPWVAACIAGIALALLFGAVLLSWSRFGRQIITLHELLSVPAYVLAKLPIYARLLWKRQVAWIRTERDDGRA
jgi:cellulose synthase/poly-beta-1,6-N-acetylglucosamine synthase-like glycosyltransferase